MGGGKVLAMLKGGTTSFEVVLTQEHEPLAILKGGGRKPSDLRFSHLVAPLSFHAIDDWPL